MIINIQANIGIICHIWKIREILRYTINILRISFDLKSPLFLHIAA